METILTAIIGGLAGLSKDVIKDSYNALKSALSKKFSDNQDLLDAVEKLEQRPDSVPRRDSLSEEMEIAKVNEDLDVIQLAKDLLEKIKQESGGETANTFNQNVTQSGSGNINIGQARDVNLGTQPQPSKE